MAHCGISAVDATIYRYFLFFCKCRLAFLCAVPSATCCMVSSKIRPLIESYSFRNIHRLWMVGEFLCEPRYFHVLVSAAMAIYSTHQHTVVSLENRVVITLWTLASLVEYRTVRHLFEVGCSTFCEIFNETCEAIVKHLLHKYISFPPVECYQQFINNFERK